jgi:peptidoglycan/xylan/chitin deacetylase (PgdA/CDA1 family)
MSSLPVHPPEPPRIPRLYIALGVLLFAAGLAASIGAGNSLRLTVDGSLRRVGPGTTVAELAEMGYLAARPGDTLSVRSGRIAREGGGTPLSVTRNGREAGAQRVLYDGDVIESSNGRDVIEATVTREKPIPVGTRFVGSGPLMTLAAPGSVGVKREQVGAISGEEVTSSVITQPTPMVVKRYGTRPGERVVALTFDDGPWPGQTNRILHILKQYKVRASFFMLGYLSKRNSALARQVADEGHLVGNHTIGHRTLTRLTAAAVDDQIERGEVAIAKSTGVTPAWFRPPGGDISPGVWSRVNHANLRVALWDVDPQDWRNPTPNQIAHNVVVNTRPGSIVLLHDGGGNRDSTIRALPIIIRSLQSRGYRFVTLDELPGS